MIKASSPSYLTQNPYSYYFRMRVPLSLQAMLQKKKMECSLKTGNPSNSKMKVRFSYYLMARFFV